MKILGKINGKQVCYQRHDTAVNWAKEMPSEKWLLLVIADEKTSTILDEIARKSIDHNVCYVCYLGEQAEKIHDIFDEILVYRQVENESGLEEYLIPDFQIITTWHKDFNEGIEFAFTTAEHNSQEIKTIFCLDAGKESSELSISNLILKIKQD